MVALPAARRGLLRFNGPMLDWCIG